MANIPNSLLFCAIVGSTVVSCGGDAAPEVEADKVSMISLESPEKPASPVAAQQEPVAEVVKVTEVNIDHWNRLPRAQRKSALAQAEFASMTDFMGIFDGNSRKVRGAVLSSATAVDAGFAANASAWGSGGIDAIAVKLASSASSSAADIAWAEALAVIALEEDNYAAAGIALGIALDGMMGAGYDRARVLELKPMIALVSQKLSKFMPFEIYQVQSGDSYWQLCRDFNSQAGKGYTLNAGWISDFNGKANYNLRLDEKLKIPSAKLSMRAWRGERLLALYADGVPIRLYEASFGRQGEPTPLGDFTLAICEKEPVYYKQGGSPVPYGNPDNPLGERWLGFKEDAQYGIHGTNSEDTIGSYESGGCLRLHNADVIELFELVKSGVPVSIDG
ncbi:MAG: L,D-transpeptidase family protein [Planctomycetes bacterium]|nr:L,D-transpeptidase family protein [Planctomycetota bacterium]